MTRLTKAESLHIGQEIKKHSGDNPVFCFFVLDTEIDVESIGDKELGQRFMAWCEEA